MLNIIYSRCEECPGRENLRDHLYNSTEDFNELHHDTAMVYSIQKMFLNYIKKHFPKVKKVEYFSDGCAAQYKNRYNFANLCMHK